MSKEFTMNCCNPDGPCLHDPYCPVGAATLAPRTCEALGVCQHPVRECTGACELPPALRAVATAQVGTEAATPEQPKPNGWVELLIAVVMGLVLGVGVGAWRLLQSTGAAS